LISGVYLPRAKKILLVGGSGALGSQIIKSRSFKNLDFPSKKKLDILNRATISKYIKKGYDLVINCAAMARMKECEKNPIKAINVNVFGTLNLVQEIMNYEVSQKKKVRLVHLSTDGVYPSTKGNYFENSPLKPYNVYGWTKLCSESVIKMLENYLIIRTRFFDKTNIRFNTAATDIFTSMIEIQNLVKEIKIMSFNKYVGIVNVGKKRKSDFDNFKKFKSNIKPCKRKDILKDINFELAKDASMNLNLLKKLKATQ